MLEKLKNNQLLIYITTLLIIVVTIIITKILTKQELIIDKIAYNILVEQLRTPTMTTFMKTITKLSNTNFMIIITIILTILFTFKWQRKNIAILIPCSLTFITLFNQTLKIIFQRARPNSFQLITATGYSFPSGHAMASMAFYGLLIYIIYHLTKNKYLKNILILINCIIILLVGISRVYLGVHYLSDVIAGYSISIIYLLILTKILKKNKLFS